MSDIDDLKSVYEEAVKRGDKATAESAVKSLDSLTQESNRQNDLNKPYDVSIGKPVTGVFDGATLGSMRTPEEKSSYIKSLPFKEQVSAVASMKSPLPVPTPFPAINVLANPAYGAGALRGLVDLKEKIQQIFTGGKPGDVVGRRNIQIPSRLSAEGIYTDPSNPAVEMVENYLGRRLTPEEKQRVLAEPDVAVVEAELSSRNRENKELAASRSAFQRSAGPEAQVVRLAVNVAPYMAPALNVPKGLMAIRGLTGAGARGGFNALSGGAIGATEFVQPGETRLGNAIQGAAWQSGIGLGLDTIRGLFATAPALAARGGLQDSIDTPYFKRGQELKRSTGVEMNLADLTGSREAERLQGQSGAFAGTLDILTDAERRKTVQFVTEFKKRLEAVNAHGGMDINTAANTIGDSFENYAGSLLKRAKALFGQGLEEASQSLGYQKKIPSSGMVNAINTEISRLNNVVGRTDEIAGDIASLERMRDVFLTKQGTPKLMDVKSVQEHLHRLTESGSGTGRFVADAQTASDRRVANFIKSALLDDLKNLAGNNSKAAKKLLEIRSMYDDVMNEHKELGQQTLGMLINRKVSASPEDFIGALRKMQPTQLEKMIRVMETANPDANIRGALKHFYFENILSKSKKSDFEKFSSVIDPKTKKMIPPQYRVEGEPEITLGRLSQNWKADDPAFNIIFNDPAQRARITEMRELLARVAKEAPNTGGGQSFVSGEAQAMRSGTGMAVNPKGQSIIFLADLITKRSMPKKIARLLNTPEGVEKIIAALHPKTRNISTITAAIEYMDRINSEPEE